MPGDLISFRSQLITPLILDPGLTSGSVWSVHRCFDPRSQTVGCLTHGNSPLTLFPIPQAFLVPLKVHSLLYFPSGCPVFCTFLLQHLIIFLLPSRPQGSHHCSGPLLPVCHNFASAADVPDCFQTRIQTVQDSCLFLCTGRTGRVSSPSRCSGQESSDHPSCPTVAGNPTPHDRDSSHHHHHPRPGGS